MSVATGKASSSTQQRRSSLIEPAASVTRTAMILTSAQHARDGHSHLGTGSLENTYQLKPQRVPKSCLLQKAKHSFDCTHIKKKLKPTHFSSIKAMLRVDFFFFINLLNLWILQYFFFRFSFLHTRSVENETC